jgi:hypothetical protein
MPYYYIHGSNTDVRTITEYKRICRNAKKLHRAAFNEAVAMAKELSDGVEHHHFPFL